jgi:hypothetical protein
MNQPLNHMPPIFILPRVPVGPEFIARVPVSAVAKGDKSGWINDKTFCEWFEHFSNVQPKRRAVATLVLADGHIGHTNEYPADCILLLQESVSTAAVRAVGLIQRSLLVSFCLISDECHASVPFSNEFFTPIYRHWTTIFPSYSKGCFRT